MFYRTSSPSGPLPKRANFRPDRADSRPERADFRPEKADFRPERADFRPDRAWGGRTNGQTNKRKSPVFYRTSSPSGPLPKKLKNAEKVKKGPTDQPTDQPNDEPTKRGVESPSTRLKIKQFGKQ